MHPVILLLLSPITTDWVWLLIITRFLNHTQRRTTVGRTPPNEWSVRRRDLYLTTHNNHNRQTSIPPRRAEDFYLPLKIRRLRPGLNPRTWVPKASTLPLDHRSRYSDFDGCNCVDDDVLQFLYRVRIWFVYRNVQVSPEKIVACCKVRRTWRPQIFSNRSFLRENITKTRAKWKAGYFFVAHSVYSATASTLEQKRTESKVTTDFESYREYEDTKKFNSITEFLPMLFGLIHCPDMQMREQKYLRVSQCYWTVTSW